MTLEEIKFCKYCNSKLKKIVYEIIESDKTNNFDRLFCGKCSRVFHFREPKKQVEKKVSKKQGVKKITKKNSAKSSK